LEVEGIEQMCFRLLGGGKGIAVIDREVAKELKIGECVKN
jgi:hypothetical protein